MSKRKIHGLAVGLLLACALAMSAGCSQMSRSVRVIYWKDPNTVYIAFDERDGQRGEYSAVHKCSRNADNTLTCAEQVKLSMVLNVLD